MYHQLGLTEHRSSVVASSGESVNRGADLRLDCKQAHVGRKARAAHDETKKSCPDLGFFFFFFSFLPRKPHNKLDANLFLLKVSTLAAQISRKLKILNVSFFFFSYQYIGVIAVVDKVLLKKTNR